DAEAATGRGDRNETGLKKGGLMSSVSLAIHRLEPQSTRGRARLAKILEAATELFLKVGYEQTSIDAILLQSGGSKSTLYAYFPTKEDLFRAVIDSVVDNNDLGAASLRASSRHRRARTLPGSRADLLGARTATQQPAVDHVFRGSAEPRGLGDRRCRGSRRVLRRDDISALAKDALLHGRAAAERARPPCACRTSRRAVLGGVSSRAALGRARPLERLAGSGRAFEPCRAFGVEFRHFGPAEPGKPEPDVESGLRLQVAEVAITLGEAREQLCVELELAARLEGIEAVLLIDR